MLGLIVPLLLVGSSSLAATGANPDRWILVTDQVPIQVNDAWARPTIPAVKSGVVYLNIANHGAEADTLDGVSTKAAGSASLHLSSTVNGVSRMRSMPSVAVKPGDALAFAPGGMHIMLEGLKAPLATGSSFPLTLHFAKAGDVSVMVTVKQQDDGAAMPGMKM